MCVGGNLEGTLLFHLEEDEEEEKEEEEEEEISFSPVAVEFFLWGGCRVFAWWRTSDLMYWLNGGQTDRQTDLWVPR